MLSICLNISAQATLWAVSNALTESRVLHARELCDIVLSKQDLGGKDNDDILLKHLVPEDKWTDELNGLVCELKTEYGHRGDEGKPCWLFNKMMFHPTTQRSNSFDYTEALAIVEPLLDKNRPRDRTHHKRTDRFEPDGLAVLAHSDRHSHISWTTSDLAEGVGFEPTSDFRRCRFSRPVPSTTRPPLHPSGRIFIALSGVA